MHIGEAILPRQEAVVLAAAELARALERNAPYYAKKPGSKPCTDKPLIERITADDTWIFVPFAREDTSAAPIVVRVNGITKAVSIEKAL